MTLLDDLAKLDEAWLKGDVERVAVQLSIEYFRVLKAWTIDCQDTLEGAVLFVRQQ